MSNIVFEIPDLPKMPNQLLRKHWTVIMKEKNLWHGYVNQFAASRFHLKWPMLPATKAKLTLTRYSTSEPDYDGLVGSFKYLIDGLVKHECLSDDKYSVIGESKYIWEKCARKDQRVRVEIEILEIPDGIRR